MKDLSDKERTYFERLSKEKNPPAELEDSLVRLLKEEGLIKTKFTMKTWMKWAAVIAAVVGAYYLGTYSSNTQSEMSYMMILMEDESFQPGEPMAMFTEYRDWMYAAREKGVEITGQELKDDATLIKSGSIIDNPNIGNQKVTGYFVFNATSKEEAIKIAQLNPHIKYGGSIQLKEYMKR